MDRDAIAALATLAVSETMEKEARFGMQAAKTGLGWLGRRVGLGGGGGAAPKPFSLGRTAVGAGALGTVGLGAAAGGQHIKNWADQQSLSPEDRYSRANTELTTRQQPLMEEYRAAAGRGDTAKMEELRGRLRSGDYGNPQMRVNLGSLGSVAGHNLGNLDFSIGTSLGGLNPWAGPTTSTLRDRMRSSQTDLQGQFRKAMTAFGAGRPQMQQKLQELNAQAADPNLLPYERQMLQWELAAIKKRLAAPPGEMPEEAGKIRSRMLGAGMADPRTADMGGVGTPLDSGSGGSNINPLIAQLNGSVAPGTLNVSPYALDNRIQQWALGTPDFRMRG